MLKAAQRVPVATYRLQLRKEFPFAAVESIAPQLEALGISDCYFSPILFSNPGSTHGYDVTDYRRIDPELGGKEGLNRLHAVLAAAGLGVLLDFVPNHMGINGPGPFNKWWQDVLENGEASPYAGYFDINWRGHRGRTQLLVPILDDHYGRVLEAGRLSVVENGGKLSIAYGDMRFPISAESAAEVFGSNAEHRTPNVERRMLEELNGKPGEARSFDRLDALIERQHYRLAYWKAGAHETNYRRFFAIDSLIGVRIEIPEVFNECHALLARLLREGLISGLRIDHIDGLWDPLGYLERLQALAKTQGPKSEGRRPDVGEERAMSNDQCPMPNGKLFVVVEKILERDEQMPGGWAAHGSTGYEFIAQMAGLMVDARAESDFTRICADFCGETEEFAAVVREKKRMVLDELFANAVDGLAEKLTALPEADRRWRDLTEAELTSAIREVMVNFSVYRTYRSGPGPMEREDRAEVERACAEAARRNPRMGNQAFEFVRDVLIGTYPEADQPAGLREYAARWAMTFQQYTGAVMAKAVEDTAFYTYNRFLGLNEVGCDPAEFGRPVEAFHAANELRLGSAPHNLLATSTHDTKLGEDARARLYALSEIPSEWREWVAEWRGFNRRHKSLVDGESAPDANEEYRIYQALLAAAAPLGNDQCPMTPSTSLRASGNDQCPMSNVQWGEFRERMREYGRKAVNEAKRHTTWSNPNEPWLAAGDRFVEAMLDPETGKEFLDSFRPRARRLAHLGMIDSLAQVALKIMSPGVPDFYQGAEGWLHHLVDPDNRRLVDFGQLQEMARSADAPLEELLREWPDGRIKYRITRDLLSFRRAHVSLFQQGAYERLETKGRFASNIVAFARTLAGGPTVIVAVPRLTAKMGCPPLGLVWEDSAVVVNHGSASGTSRATLRSVLTGAEIAADEELPARELFRELPIAVLTGRHGGRPSI